MREIILETNDLTVGYAQRGRVTRSVAQRLNLRLEAGELVCLLGPNGAGKSTLLRSLAGMQRPLQGTVQIAGVNPHHVAPAALARLLGVVLTERAEVGALSVYALVALGRYPYTDWSGRLNHTDEAAIQAALAAVGIEDFAPRLVNQLSDGERQKVMIARALAQEPKLLLLDEPTAFLDLPRRVELLGILRRLARQSRRAIVLSTHDLDLALRSADQLWLLAPGAALRVGTPEELVLDGSLQEVFHSAEVHFDAESGTFKFQQHALAHIDLVGSGLPGLWTQRALEREGFIVNGAESATLRLEVCQHATHTVWTLHDAQGRSDYAHLSAVLRAIKAQCFDA